MSDGRAAATGRNTSGHFSNVLTQPLDLSRGHGHWMVGLKKIIYQNYMKTIVDESITYRMRGAVRWTQYPITITTEWFRSGRFNVWTRVQYAPTAVGAAVDGEYALELRVDEPLALLEVVIFPRRAGSEGVAAIKETIRNVKSGTMKVWRFHQSFPQTVKTFSARIEWTTANIEAPIPSGRYESLEQLCKALTLAISASAAKFEVTEDNKCRLSLVSYTMPYVRLNNDLHLMLGFDRREFSETAVAAHLPQLDRGRFALFVCSNIVEYSLVGNAQIPLLDVITIPKQEFGKNKIVEPVRPTYRRVVVNHIGEIEILCQTQDGKRDPFLDGHSRTLVELHFINTGTTAS